MKPTFALVGLALSLLSSIAAAAPAHHSAAPSGKRTAVTAYQCAKCHMTFTAAQAKKDRYKDPMDGGKLVPVARK